MHFAKVRDTHTHGREEVRGSKRNEKKNVRKRMTPSFTRVEGIHSFISSVIFFFDVSVSFYLRSSKGQKLSNNSLIAANMLNNYSRLCVSSSLSLFLFLFFTIFGPSCTNFISHSYFIYVYWFFIIKFFFLSISNSHYQFINFNDVCKQIEWIWILEVCESTLPHCVL